MVDFAAKYVAVDATCLKSRRRGLYLAGSAQRASEDKCTLYFNPAAQVYRLHKDQIDACAGPDPHPPPEPPAAKPPKLRPDFPLYTGYKGAALWAELEDQLHPSEQTVAAVLAKLPCGKCLRHASELLAANPIDYSSLAAYRYCIWLLHDQVNAAIGNPRPNWPEIRQHKGWEDYKPENPAA